MMLRFVAVPYNVHCTKYILYLKSTTTVHNFTNVQYVLLFWQAESGWREDIFSNIFEPFCAVPASVSILPAGRRITVREGETVKLECMAAGHPSPTIKWSKKVEYNLWF